MKLRLEEDESGADESDGVPTDVEADLIEFMIAYIGTEAKSKTAKGR